MSEITTRDTVEALNELRQTVESKMAHTAEAQEKIAKLEAFFEKQEDQNDKLTKEVMEAKNRELELAKKYEDMEAKLYRAPIGEVKQKSEELKSFESFIVKGRQDMSPDEVKYLRTDNDTAGGFLAPPEYVEDIIKNITEISPMRSVARIRRTSRSTIEIPRRTSNVVGAWIGEGQTATASNSSYGLEEISVNKLMVPVEITVEMMTDAAFDMETEINSDVAESFAQLEGAAFVGGDGVKKPEGFLVNADVASVVTGNATDITADSIIDIEGELKEGYNPSYMLNRRTLAEVRKLKTGDGQYLWANGLAAGQPNTLNGLPYVSAIDMDDIGAGNFPIALGDWFRGYTIVDSINMAVVRDMFTKSTEGKIVFVFHRRVGGQVVLPEAIKKLVVSA